MVRVSELKQDYFEKVSIIMTVYNGGRFLRDAIESCLNQTYTNLELIIIDDGSFDNSLEIIKSFEDKRIKLLINESNKGQSYSRNIGIKESSGEYIAIMDADDMMYPNRIEKQLNYLKIEGGDICFSWADLIDVDGKIIGDKKTTLNINYLRAKLLFECPLIHPTAFWRKDSLIQNDLWYDRYYTYAQDYELWSRAMHFLKFVVVGESLLKFRFRNEGSISFNKVEEQEMFRKLISDREIKLLCGENVNYLSSLQGLRKIYYGIRKVQKVDEEVKQYFRDLTNWHFQKYPYRFKKFIQKIIIR